MKAVIVSDGRHKKKFKLKYSRGDGEVKASQAAKIWFYGLKCLLCWRKADFPIKRFACWGSKEKGNSS